ncbi:MAG: hypothetical protein JWM85_2907 [Acidimicrobiaceae bacterium]|nr:hypothetical protein [Acidimicrobiaceae bacterium]
MNCLQSLQSRHEVLLSRNMEDEVEPSGVLGSLVCVRPTDLASGAKVA